MTQSTQMEQGHIYKSELPSSYHEGQTGKGVAIGGTIGGKVGTPMPVGDGSAAKLKKEWSSAEKAHGKFPNF